MTPGCRVKWLKRALVVSVFIGLVIGFGIGYAVYQGVIAELEQQVDDLITQMANLARALITKLAIVSS